MYNSIMNDKDAFILEYASSHDGYLCLPAACQSGIQKNKILGLAKEQKLVRQAPGIYTLPETIPDELYILHLRFPSLVFSHETALYYLGYSDQAPFVYAVTVPKGFHSPALQGYKVIQQKKDLMNEGKAEIPTEFQNKIPVYCIERTLCDLLHKPKELDLERFIPAIQKYLKSKERNNIKLLNLAKKIGVEKKMRTYMEAIL